MPRQNRRRVEAPQTAARGGGEQRVDWRGVSYSVRPISGQAAVKPYRCPGCDQEIRAGVAHLVCWPVDDLGADERRHWHTGCWSARGRRSPGVQRSRSAPRH